MDEEGILTMPNDGRIMNGFDVELHTRCRNCGYVIESGRMGGFCSTSCHDVYEATKQAEINRARINERKGEAHGS